MTRALDEMLSKIIAVEGVDYLGTGRVNFIGVGIAISGEKVSGAPGVPTTINLTLTSQSPINPGSVPVDQLENLIPAWDAEGQLKLSGLGTTAEYDEESTYLPAFWGPSFEFGGYESQNLFTTDWLEVPKRSGTQIQHRVLAKAGTTEDEHIGERQELVRNYTFVSNAGIDEGYTYDFAIPLLQNASLVAAIPDDSRVYLFDVLLDLRMALGVKALARLEICAWRDGGVTYVADPVLYEIVGQGEAYSWAGATITTLVVSHIPRLAIEFDLSGVSGTYPSTDLRVSIKHSHARRPE